jgi:hypothetical protein
MEPSWSRQIQFGVFGSFSLPLHTPTQGPKHLTVPSCRRRTYIIFVKIIIVIIVFILIIVITIYYYFIEIIEIIDVIVIMLFIERIDCI